LNLLDIALQADCRRKARHPLSPNTEQSTKPSTYPSGVSVGVLVIFSFPCYTLDQDEAYRYSAVGQDNPNPDHPQDFEGIDHYGVSVDGLVIFARSLRKIRLARHR